MKNTAYRQLYQLPGKPSRSIICKKFFYKYWSGAHQIRKYRASGGGPLFDVSRYKRQRERARRKHCSWLRCRFSSAEVVLNSENPLPTIREFLSAISASTHRTDIFAQYRYPCMAPEEITSVAADIFYLARFSTKATWKDPGSIRGNDSTYPIF